MAARKPLLRQLAAHLLVHRQPHGLVEIALLPGKFERLQDLGLWRQIGGHHRLGPPQQERFNPPREHAAALAILLLLDRSAEDPGKAAGIAEQPRHQKGELRPQLPEMVLDRRPGQAQPMARVEPADEPGRLRIGILDRLRLVEHRDVPGDRKQQLGVARQQRVGRHHHIGIADRGEMSGAVGTVQ